MLIFKKLKCIVLMIYFHSQMQLLEFLFTDILRPYNLLVSAWEVYMYCGDFSSDLYAVAFARSCRAEMSMTWQKSPHPYSPILFKGLTREALIFQGFPISRWLGHWVIVMNLMDQVGVKSGVNRYLTLFLWPVTHPANWCTLSNQLCIESLERTWLNMQVGLWSWGGVAGRLVVRGQETISLSQETWNGGMDCMQWLLLCVTALLFPRHQRR